MVLTISKYPELASLGLQEMNNGCFDGSTWFGSGKKVVTYNPNTGEALAEITTASAEDYERCVEAMRNAQRKWADTPAPRRGEIVRQIGEALRLKSKELGLLVSLEVGKVKSEGLGEVQEFIDICDLACGMSRQLPGQVLPSERPGHILLETWSPLGLVGIISAFNFPVAVYGWNASVSLIAGNCNLWKGSPSTSLCTIATMNIVGAVLQRNGFPGVCVSVGGDGEIGERICRDERMKLISFTGSTKVGRSVSEIVSRRFGKSILELGGNNASVIMDDADIEMAVRGSAFGAVGTAGQRCTSLRRLLVHAKNFDTVREKLLSVYEQITRRHIGNSVGGDAAVLLGPVHSERAVEMYLEGIARARAEGLSVIFGGNRIISGGGGFFVEPAIIEVPVEKASHCNEELFVPILYLVKISSFEEAVKINNMVPQGLSSSLYSRDIRNVFAWIAQSDCGIVNVNTGTSGAEIGGAFGGEKETGNGRESGSDSWKQYMKRSTCVVNFSNDLPLAQGVEFNI